MSGMIGECRGISEGIYGVSRGNWRVYGGLRRVSGCLFPSISSNFRKLQMRSLKFSSRPGGPRCLKYQNVPKLRSFWPIGKPRERFQSRVIKVYFIPFLLDHTVANYVGGDQLGCNLQLSNDDADLFQVFCNLNISIVWIHECLACTCCRQNNWFSSFSFEYLRYNP